MVVRFLKANFAKVMVSNCIAQYHNQVSFQKLFQSLLYFNHIKIIQTKFFDFYHSKYKEISVFELFQCDMLLQLSIDLKSILY